MAKSILARVASLLPRVVENGGEVLWQPRRAVTIYDAYDLWYGTSAFTQPASNRMTRCCSDRGADYLITRC